MNLTGLLNAFTDLPEWQAFVAEIDKKTAMLPLRLPRAARPPVLAELFRACNMPILFIAGRIDNVGKWQQSLEAWLPDDANILRYPEPTPLPFERGPWSERSRLRRIEVLTQLMAGQHPQIPAAESPTLILASARALLQKSLPKRRFITATKALRVGQILDLE
jgi:transcription-repair coupling factor (superfamily II helicase)